MANQAWYSSSSVTARVGIKHQNKTKKDLIIVDQTSVGPNYNHYIITCANKILKYAGHREVLCNGGVEGAVVRGDGNSERTSAASPAPANRRIRASLLPLRGDLTNINLYLKLIMSVAPINIAWS